MERNKLPGIPEIWKAYPKNPKYELSSEGRVRRKYKKSTHYIQPLYYNDGRSTEVAIGKGNKKVSLGRAMWETFRGEIPEGYCIQFKNECKSMCDIYNLYLEDKKVVTSKIFAKVRHKRKPSNSKKVIDNITGKVYRTISEASRELYVDMTTIKNVCNRKYATSKTGIDVDWYVG